MTLKFELKDRIVIITGGAGLLGEKHAEAIIEIGGIPILFDLDGAKAKEKTELIKSKYNAVCEAYEGDVTSEKSVLEISKKLIDKYGRVDVLINNAAANPKMEEESDDSFTRLERFSLDIWQKDLAVGLTGAFICSKVFGTLMSEQGNGVIVNISSDLGLIAPDQRIYRRTELPEENQPVKPITYSVVKHGLIGLTKYLATYWAEKGVRSNALCPGGINTSQPEDFVKKLNNLIPLGRMAEADEYKSAIQFLCSDASSYMNGACLVIDGGRTCW